MVQERNAGAYRTPARSRVVPARPKSASAADIQARTADAGGRYGHYLATGQDGAARTNNVSMGQLGADPLAGLFQGTPPINPGGSGGGGGGGRRGGGGGGGGGGVSPATAQAYKDLLASFSNGVGSEYDAYEASMRAAYDPSKVNAIYDQQSAGITSAADAGRGRLAPIMQGLDSRAATARTGVNQAMSDGDARLAALQAEYQAQAQGANAGLNNVMDRFGAGPVQDTGAQSLLNLFANSRIANSRSQGIMDAGLADRPAVYGGLEADVLSGISRDQTGLESRVAQQRAAGLTQNDQALQQILGQTGIDRMKAENELRVQLAELGISV